jgi:hypothetical protein
MVINAVIDLYAGIRCCRAIYIVSIGKHTAAGVNMKK